MFFYNVDVLACTMSIQLTQENKWLSKKGAPLKDEEKHIGTTHNLANAHIVVK